MQLHRGKWNEKAVRNKEDYKVKNYGEALLQQGGGGIYTRVTVVTWGWT